MKIGVIADDFTGASDAASFLTKGGMKTMMFNGIPVESSAQRLPDAVVIALKTRTEPVKEAVSISLDACRWFMEHGVEHIYIKYCSTFDSTPQGNIGPICDAIMEELDIPYTILCPALPVNGRTVKNGSLFVKGVPLEESSMKNHPLTPMWDSRIAVLMKNQSRYPVYSLSIEEVRGGETRIKERAACIRQNGICDVKGDPNERKTTDHIYFVPDYDEQEQDIAIAEAFGSLPLLTGGSGILEALARKYLYDSESESMDRVLCLPHGNALILAGSCSVATLSQIDTFKRAGKPSFQIYPEQLMAGEQSLQEMETFIESHPQDDVLIYSSASVDEVRKAQLCASDKEKISALLEQVMAAIAEWGVSHGRTRIIVAGGETSGAVTKGLGFSSYYIGESVVPGVPVIIPCRQSEIRLILKSGNFGDQDFFLDAIQKSEV